MVLAYNQTDWTYGWAHYMDGFSIFYSPKGEGKTQIISHWVYETCKLEFIRLQCFRCFGPNDIGNGQLAYSAR